MMLRQLLAQSFPTACTTTSSTTPPTTSLTSPPPSSNHGVIISSAAEEALRREDQQQHDLDMSVSPSTDHADKLHSAKMVSESPELAVLSKMQPSFGPSANSAFHTLAAAAAAAAGPNGGGLFDIGEYQHANQSNYHNQQPAMDVQNDKCTLMYGGGQSDVANYLNGSTSDLFSSTYAVLASDPVAGFPQLAPALAEWPSYSFDSSAHAISIAAAERLHGCSMNNLSLASMDNQQQQQPTTAYLITNQPSQQFGVSQQVFQNCHPGHMPTGQTLLNQATLSSPLLQYHPNVLPPLHPAQFQHSNESLNGENSTIQAQQHSLGQSPASFYHIHQSTRVQETASPSVLPNLNSQSAMQNENTPLSSRRFSSDSIKTEEDTSKRPAESATEDGSEQKSSGKHRFARDVLEAGKKKANCQSQAPFMKRNSSQSVFTEAFRKITSQVPVDMICGAAVVRPSSSNGDASSGEEDEVKEKVMCLACKGVYPSRRSLTGHIGRNEKCREVIGRNYLDQLAQLTSQDIIPDLSASDGVSPVCPHCDRFISHYKGNIRRHINQCKKGKEASKEQKEEGGSTENEVGGGNDGGGGNSSPPSSFPLAEGGGASSVDLPSISSSTCSSTSSSITPNMNQHPHQQHVIMSHQQPPLQQQHHMPMSTAAPLNIIHHHQSGTVYLQRPFDHMNSVPQNGSYSTQPPQNLAYATYEQQHNGISYSNGVHQQQMVVTRSAGHMDGEDEDQYQPNGGHLLFGQQHQTPTPQHPHATNFKKEVYRTIPAQSVNSPLNLSSPLSNQTTTQSKSHHKKSDTASGQTCSDPYSCVWCTFSTAYKGNMKRHLISCHAVNDELLRKYSFDVDRLRQSAINRPTIDELPIVPREVTQSVSSNRSQSGKSPTHRNGSNGSNSQRNKRMLEPQPTTASGAIRGRPRKNSKLTKDNEKSNEIKLEQDTDEANTEMRPTSEPQISQQSRPTVYHQPVHQETTVGASPYSPQTQLFVIMNNGGNYESNAVPPQHISRPSSYSQSQFHVPNGAFKPLLPVASEKNFEGSNDSGISVQSFINTNPANL